DGSAAGVAQRAVPGRPRLGARAAGPDVTGDTAAVVASGWGGPQHLPGAGVGEPGAGLAAVFVDLEHLQAGAVWIEITDVHGVAVAVAGVPQRPAVVVDGHRTEDDLIAAVAVDVGDRQV